MTGRNRPQTRLWRLAPLVATLVSTALVLLVAYEGPGRNLPLLVWATALLGLALALAAPDLPRCLPQRNRWLLPLAALWLGGLLHGWLGSVMPSASLPGAWALALVVVGFALGRWLHLHGVSVLWVLALPVAVAASTGLAEWLALGQRPTGWLHDPNNLATLMNLALLPLAGWLLRTTREPRRVMLVLALMVLLLSALSVSGSRTGHLLWLLAMAGLLLAGWRGGAPRGQWLALALVSGVALLATLWQPGTGQGWTEMANNQHALRGRSALAAGGIALWQQAPLAGHGLLTFGLLYPGIRGPEDPASAGFYAHNDWLQLLQEGGLLLTVPLLVLAVVLLLVAARRALAALRGDGSGLATLGVALGCGVVLAHSLVNFTLYVPVFALLLGLLLARLAGRSAGGAGRRPWLAAVVVLCWLPGWLLLAEQGLVAATMQGQPGWPGSAAVQQRLGGQQALVGQLLRHGSALPVVWHTRAALMARGAPDPLAPEAGVPATGVPAAGVPAAGVPAAGVPAPGVPAPGAVAAAWQDAVAAAPLDTGVRKAQIRWLREQPDSAAEQVRLLQDLLALDRSDVAVLVALVRTHLTHGDQADALAVLRREFLPMAAVHHRRAPPAVDWCLAQLNRLALDLGQPLAPAEQAMAQAAAQW